MLIHLKKIIILPSLTYQSGSMLKLLKDRPGGNLLFITLVQSEETETISLSFTQAATQLTH